MGKKNFASIYKKIKADQGGKNAKCKIHLKSDKFQKDKSYSGIIIYAIDNKTDFQLLITDTQGIPPDPQDGLVHYDALQRKLNIPTKDQNGKVLRSGFSYNKGQVMYRSGFCNANSQPNGETDYKTELSKGEQKLAEYCWNEYLKKNVGDWIEIPDSVESFILAS